MEAFIHLKIRIKDKKMKEKLETEARVIEEGKESSVNKVIAGCPIGLKA